MTTTLQTLTPAALNALVAGELARAVAKATVDGAAAEIIYLESAGLAGREVWVLNHHLTAWRAEILVDTDSLEEGRNTVTITLGKPDADVSFFAKLANSPDGFTIRHHGNVPETVLRASIRGALRYQRIQARLAAGLADFDKDMDLDGSEPDEDDAEPATGGRPAPTPAGPLRLLPRSERSPGRDDTRGQEGDEAADIGGRWSEGTGPTLTPITDPAELERIHLGIADGTIKPVG